MNNFRVSSEFGESRSTGGHYAVDFAGKTPGGAMGAKIPSISAGTVTQVFNNNKTAGNGVTIKGPDGYSYRYIHMKDAPTLKVGDKISIGQNLGLIGSTGRSSGPHLDLKVTDSRGNPVDPMKIINGMAKSPQSAPTGKMRGVYGESSSSLPKGGSTYTNTWKMNKEALKAPGYQAYKSHLSQALQTGKISESWVVALTELIGRESTWNPKVGNKKSSAWGYGQFLSSTRSQYEKKTGLSYNDPVNQIIMTAQYVKDRYGTPEKALQFWDKNNWY
ncbi:peptidoglycan DD-metalloendopeptidase family protein [Metabacillus dongyingensis]|uniref:M23 family metallopeptidase n=1 Tax=Metabacillus dongyingensis TaxID=2874282 RepID=UPI003B8D2595